MFITLHVIYITYILCVLYYPLWEYKQGHYHLYIYVSVATCYPTVLAPSDPTLPPGHHQQVAHDQPDTSCVLSILQPDPLGQSDFKLSLQMITHTIPL